MKLIKDLLSINETMKVYDTELSDQGTEDNLSNLDNGEFSISDLADLSGFAVKRGLTKNDQRSEVTLTKKIEVKGDEIILQYLINPATSAWVLRFGRTNGNEMIDLKSGEDSSSLFASIKRPPKITPFYGRRPAVMNLYDLHTDPKSLYGYDRADMTVPLGTISNQKS